MNQNNINDLNSFVKDITKKMHGFPKLIKTIIKVDTENLSEEQKKEVSQGQSEIENELNKLPSLLGKFNNII